MEGDAGIQNDIKLDRRLQYFKVTSSVNSTQIVSYLTVNTFSVHYKYQPVSNVTILNKHPVWAKC